jgi:hypothetical protein
VAIRQLARRKLVTLIAALPYSEGFVVSADSEEHCGSFRRTVQKIIPEKIGNIQFFIAGAGVGTLIDSLIIRVKEQLNKKPASDLESFRKIVQNEIRKLYRDDIPSYPAPDEDKVHKFIVAARSETPNSCAVWGSRHSTLEIIKKPELAGIEDAVYDHVAKRVYFPNAKLPQAVLAALYVMVIGKETSTLIRGDVSVAVVRKDGIHMEDSSYISNMEARLKKYEKSVNLVFLECADTSISVSHLEESIKKFSDAALNLHRFYIDGIVRDLTLESLSNVNDVVPRIPPGSVITFGAQGHQLEHDPEKAKKLREMPTEVVQYMEQRHQEFTCVGCGSQFEYVSNPHLELRVIGQLNCPDCGVLNPVLTTVVRIRKVGTDKWMERDSSDQR